MTRKQALLAVTAKLRGIKENECVADKLDEICRVMPFTEWDEQTIMDCIEQFMAVHNRLPSATDFSKKNELPSHTVIKHRFGLGVRDFMSQYFPDYYKPSVTRKQALILAYNMLTNEPEARKKIEELIDEYPFCKWTPANILDGVSEFYRINGRLPYERELGKSINLPSYKHFAYKFGVSPTKWYRLFCNDLFIENEKNKHLFRRDYLQEFRDEYLRVTPYSKDDFNRKRDGANCCLAEVVMKNTGVDSWRQLLEKCHLPVYEYPNQEEDMITEVEVIILDDNKEVMYTYILDEFGYLDREFLF